VKLGTAILGCAVLGLAVGSATAHISSRQQRPTSGTQPAPIAGKGYREVFRDEFTRLNRHVWDNHIWYDAPPNSRWSGFQHVSHGVLHLRTSRRFTYRGGTWPQNTITTKSSGRRFKFGYFEARLKWTAAPGAWPGFWLMSYRHATNPSWPSVSPYCASHQLAAALCWAAELDVFEGQGSEADGFYGTLHRNSCNCYGAPDSQNSRNVARVRKDLGRGWHTYAALWTPGQITWYLDSRRLFSTRPYESTNQPMFLLLQMWTGGWTAEPGATTPDVLETQVDYVRVWQR